MGVLRVTENGKERMIIREEVTPYLQIERKVKEVLFEDKEIHESELVEDDRFEYPTHRQHRVV